MRMLILGGNQMEQPKAAAEVSDAGKRTGVVRYYLTCQRCKIAPVQTYGISITFTGEDGSTYADQVDDICCIQAQAENLLKLLAKHTVTPVSLRDVVEDYLAAT